jgi:predicted CXXCH cytochrome family protein
MKVVGHVEQMHRSACYQRSESFTCVTCHSPHHEPKMEKLAEHYRAVCLSCHESEDCQAEAERRARAKDNCVQCHMPTTSTDIPHLAFTHHRIGIHQEAPAGETDEPLATQPGELIPFLRLPVAAGEQPRSLGLAYADLALHERQPQLRRHYQQQAWQQLTLAARAPALDSEALATLASLAYELEQPGSAALAKRALDDPQLAGLPRCNALFIVADAQFSAERYADALTTLDTLSKLRRHSLPWLLRADCEKQLRNVAGIEKALLQAVSIDPGLPEAQRELAALYRRQGDMEAARRHELLSQP